MSIRIQGLNETLGAIDIFGLETLKNVEKQIEKSAVAVEAAAKAGAPVDTGNLQRKILKTVSNKELSAKITYMGKRRAFYGKFIEFGTKTRAARPFLGPAWEREKDVFITGMVNAANEANK